MLKDELIAAISRHIDIDPTAVRIEMSQEGREQRLIADIPLRPAGGAREWRDGRAKGIESMRVQSLRLLGGILISGCSGAVALLVIFGITMIRSAVAGNIELVELNLVNARSIFAVGGCALPCWLSQRSITTCGLRSAARCTSARSSLLAVLTIVGAALFGSARWFDTGVILIQPSEIAKIVLILVLADFFTRNQQKMHRPALRWRAALCLTMGITVLDLAPAQPEHFDRDDGASGLPCCGPAGCASSTWLLFIAGGIFAAAPGLPIPGGLPAAAYPELSCSPIPNARHGDIYNIQQALISIGSGGLLGQGYGQGTQVQLRFLKVRWSDFIFSAMAQEFGFIGTLVVILILLFVIWRCLRAARLASRYLRRVDLLMAWRR